MIPVASSQSKKFTLQPAAVVQRGLPPPIKIPGGKSWLVSKMRELYAPHQHRRFVEPFCGAAACSFGLLPERVLLGDKNPYVVNILREIQKGLNLTVLPMRYESDYYYACRNWFNDLIRNPTRGTSAERARLTYYLSKTCFNGLMRFNNSGFFNAPFGQHKTVTYRENFNEYVQPMKNWLIWYMDFSQQDLEPEDFIYADPPYWGTFTNYAAGGFDWKDQIRLWDWLSNHEGPVVTTNSSAPELMELYESTGFQIEIIEEPRRISRTGDRTPALCMLATKGL